MVHVVSYITLHGLMLMVSDCFYDNPIFPLAAYQCIKVPSVIRSIKTRLDSGFYHEHTTEMPNHVAMYDCTCGYITFRRKSSLILASLRSAVLSPAIGLVSGSRGNKRFSLALPREGVLYLKRSGGQFCLRICVYTLLPPFKLDSM